MFGIFPKGELVSINGELIQPALIIINEFEEVCYMPVSHWNISDYKYSWLNSLEEGFINKNHSALAVSMYESAQANFLFTWVLYFEGNDVYVQNNIMFLNEHEGFTPEKINKSIKPRAIYNEDGMAISEWHTDMNSVMSFFNSLKN
ncbi:hypothetical protein [Escherichia albertii]|uniref:hypothetical protein n=1 Tax=Escherichia albertii TaxID=208962 RepID=UPI0007432BDC|nr:hypothetical protein [Escherichia albertii]MCZ8627512.1 hypothetical protein [Escherichia albertii]MCZ8633264.1 hypothetical protein [Escherichia albertii]MCZ8669546.1 hypothetical protein [Escherichia albertii]